MKLPQLKLTCWLNILLIFSLMSNLLAPLSALAAAPIPDKSVGLETTRRDNEPNITVKAAPLPSTLLFLDTLNPATGWTFENYAYVTNTDGYGDSYALRVTEQSGITSKTSWAEKSIAVPSSLDTLYLSFYHKRCPGANGGYWRVAIDGNTVATEFNSPGSWTLKQIPVNLAGYAGDGQVTLRITVLGYIGVHCTLFDNISLSTDDLLPVLLPDQSLAPNECPFCGNAERQNYVGGPINTQSGNYGYQAADFNIPTSGQPLRFERSYNSYTVLTNTVIYSRPLGYGWTHNYDLDLTFASGEVQLKALHGSRMRFTDNGNGTYSPFLGYGPKWSAAAAARPRFTPSPPPIKRALSSIIWGAGPATWIPKAMKPR